MVVIIKIIVTTRLRLAATGVFLFGYGEVYYYDDDVYYYYYYDYQYSF